MTIKAKKAKLNNSNNTTLSCLNDDCLRVIFAQLSLSELIHHRVVSSRWNILLREKCRLKRSLKLFASYLKRGIYCSVLFEGQSPQHHLTGLHFHPRGHDDDLILKKAALLSNNEASQQIIELFPLLETFVFTGFTPEKFYDSDATYKIITQKLTYHLSVFATNWAASLTTLVIDFIPDWSTLVPVTLLRHLYIIAPFFDCDMNIKIIEQETLQTAQKVLCRLVCFTILSLPIKYLPLLSTKNLKQLSFNDLVDEIDFGSKKKIITSIKICINSRQLIADNLNYICTSFTSLTYLHMPTRQLDRLPPLDQFLQIAKLPNLRELSISCNPFNETLPRLADIEQYSLQLKSVTKLNITAIIDSISCSVILALCPALQFIVITTKSDVPSDANLGPLRSQLAGTGIRVQFAVELIAPILGQIAEEYTKRWFLDMDWPKDHGGE